MNTLSSSSKQNYIFSIQQKQEVWTVINGVQISDTKDNIILKNLQEVYNWA